MQFGFRANHCTTTANCFIIESIKAKIDQGRIVCAVFLDLRKAYLLQKWQKQVFFCCFMLVHILPQQQQSVCQDEGYGVTHSQL